MAVAVGAQKHRNRASYDSAEKESGEKATAAILVIHIENRLLGLAC